MILTYCIYTNVYSVSMATYLKGSYFLQGFVPPPLPSTMAKDREDRKKEKREKKEKKEKKERKRREAEELAVREKKISKKHKSKSKAAEKPEKKPKKKSKKLQVVEEKPLKKSKKHKKPTESESESEETVTVPPDDSHPIKIPITTTTTTNESDSDSEFDKEDLKHLLETYTKEELVNLIHKTAEKGSRLISAVLESAELDSSKRNIFVRGLGWDTTHETLKAAFEVYGEIEECSVVMDKDTGRAKGYGFVMFKTRKGCREALRNPEKRMFNRTVSCNLAAAKPAGAGKAREPVESVKIDLTQSEVVLPGPPPGLDLGYGLDKGHKNVPQMYGGQNMPFYGHGHAPPGFNPMYFMGNQMGPGVPNFPMFGPGMMTHGPANHMGMAGQYGGEGNGVGPSFDGERAWYLR
ncbi:UBP1-associated proteins 1B-like [Brassica napus]|uniref:UBP1-associated proteins 1B-like n=1 Tax=Brassica napus TaxID=3708 RepID=UPI00207899AB|nr:UBP1-associated proteins 1B-like [Brassica napus]